MDKSHLSDLGAEDSGLIYGLPYRVGVWMSHADDDGGEDDDKKEMKALEKYIKGISHSEQVPAFIREVLQQTLSHKEKWPLWADHSFDVLADCEKAVGILRAYVSETDRRNYKKLLVNIARKVAGAHGEYGEGFEDQGNFLVRMAEKINDKIHGRKTDSEFANISAAEDAALQRLITALRADEEQEGA